MQGGGDRATEGENEGVVYGCAGAVHELTSAVILGRLRVLKGAEEPLAEVEGEVPHLQVGLQEETEALLVDALWRGGADP